MSDILLLEVVLFLAGTLILDAWALEKKAVFYSVIGTVGSLYALARLAQAGPSTVVVSVSYASGSYTPYYLPTQGGLDLIAFVALTVIVSAVMSINMSLSGTRGGLPEA